MDKIMNMQHIYNDGGRKVAGYTCENVGDCTVRAIATATETDYKSVYDALRGLNKKYNPHGKTSPRNGNTSRKAIREYMESLGWVWVPTMGIGTGCKVHLRSGELPIGRLVVSVSRHMTAVIDGVIHDTYDPSRGGTRCVYGYFQKG